MFVTKYQLLSKDILIVPIMDLNEEKLPEEESEA